MYAPDASRSEKNLWYLSSEKSETKRLTKQTEGRQWLGGVPHLYHTGSRERYSEMRT